MSHEPNEKTTNTMISQHENKFFSERDQYHKLLKNSKKAASLNTLKRKTEEEKKTSLPITKQIYNFIQCIDTIMSSLLSLATYMNKIN